MVLCEGNTSFSSHREKGRLSVLDADFLIVHAEIFEVSVGDLLGRVIEEEMNRDAVADQLEQLNALFAERFS